MFLPDIGEHKVSKSVSSDLKESLTDLFIAMKIDTIMVEDDLAVPVKNFIKDFVKVIDEVRTEQDIVSMWHIDPTVAKKVFMLLNDVIYEQFNECDSEHKEEEDSDIEYDVLDENSDSD